MDLYGFLLRHVFFRLDPEVAHEWVLSCLSHSQLLAPFSHILFRPFPKNLPLSFFGIPFRNPVGLAAGMDKNGVALLAWEQLGFGFVEMGTVTALPQPGNPRPRLFRFPELGALINRMGFNNEGAKHIAYRLEFLRSSGRWPQIPIGINIGKSKMTPLESAHTDYLESFRLLYPYGDYFVLNLSSPNTPGLRSLQNIQPMTQIIHALRDWEGTISKPLLIKIAPDLSSEDIVSIAKLCEKEQLAGIVATNTTLDHSAIPSHQDEAGGLSGKPLQERSNAIIRKLRKVSQLPIIGSGGILTDRDAYAKFEAGAQLVQIYTGLIYRGPQLIREICDFLRLRFHSLPK